MNENTINGNCYIDSINKEEYSVLEKDSKYLKDYKINLHGKINKEQLDLLSKLMSYLKQILDAILTVHPEYV